LLKFVRQIVGVVLLLCGSFFFFAFTVNLTANIRIAGPMNLWPPPVWVYLILDTFFVLLAVAGMKVMGLKDIAAGSVAAIVALLTLILIIINHVNAPPREGFSDNYISASVESYVAAYMIVGLVLLVGLALIIGHDGES